MHVETMLGIFAFSSLSYSCPQRGDSKPNNRFAKMRALSNAQSSNFDRLPTELVLKICESLSAYDLWHNIRPTSRRLAACAQEILPRKFFQESSINIRWCCFWCSLGHHPLHATCSRITRLFSNAQNVEITMISDRALMTKVIFGNLCSLVTSREPQIRIRLEEEERDIRFVSGEIWSQGQKYTADSDQNLQLCRRKFLAWYFARRRQEVAKGRIVRSVGYAAHIFRFFTTSAILLLIGFAATLFVCVAMEIYKLVRNCCKGLTNMMRFCLGKGPLLE